MASDQTAASSGQFDDSALQAIRYVVAAVVAADGRVAQAEPAAGVEVMRRFGAESYSLTDLDDDLITHSRSDLADELRAAGPTLDVAGKEAVVTAAAYLASSDGDADQWELDVAREVGEALGLSADHTQSTIDRELADRS